MVYGYSGDNDRLAWLKYDYRTRWSFKGGGTYETDWTEADAPMIDVFAPYERRTVQLLGSAEALRARGEAGLLTHAEMSRFEWTLRSYCSGYIAGRRAEAPPRLIQDDALPTDA